ncbi:AMP-binding protein [Granulosicoccaceae sp. 1_MG-2023]|nr:AMP-binding protein [Granulosicoccaceae sp. 1_MG-2023]
MNRQNTDFYDELETRSPAERLQAQMQALPAQLRYARENTPAYAALLADVDVDSINSLDALAGLPVTRKSELIDAQGRARPFGGFAAGTAGRMRRVFSSPGPIYEPEGKADDYWRLARALYAAGFRRDDLIHNAYSYHFTPAGAMMETGAQALGCGVFPAGTGQTELQVEAIAGLQPDGYVGTPSFLRILIEKAAEKGQDISSLKKALVSGEALPASLRELLSSAGIDVLQAYATADLGLIAYESPAMEGLIVDEGVIVEIVRPGTGDPVAEGEVGEVLVTTFSQAYPLVRFATGDLSAVLPGTSACGRTNMRIKGWMGRADQTTKVKGMFIHPEQVARLLRDYPDVLRARVVVTNPDNRDHLELCCELEHAPPALATELEAGMKEIFKLRGSVRFVAPGTLANDGKIIEDARALT